MRGLFFRHHLLRPGGFWTRTFNRKARWGTAWPGWMIGDTEGALQSQGALSSAPIAKLRGLFFGLFADFAKVAVFAAVHENFCDLF